MSPVAALGQAMWMSQRVTLLHLTARDSSEKPFLIFRWNPLHHAEYLIANIVIGRFITFALYFNGKNGKKTDSQGRTVCFL